ncbi:MAG: DUF3365 domain-containing protein [Clostridiales bacterium]|nr:DUF3365 domain-containing protein [Clostridiales bacterium]
MGGVFSTITGKVLVATLAILIVTVAFAGVQSADTIRVQQRHLALSVASSYVDKIVVTRRWVSEHAGVYVLQSADVTPNPYLPEDERTLELPDGTVLVRVNPAYFVRLTDEWLVRQTGISARVVGLEPLNPDNAADRWEREAIESAASTDDERHLLTERDGAEVLRFARPLAVEAACVNCHDEWAGAVGSIRGALSVTMPYGPFAVSASELIRRSWIQIGLLGLLATGMTVALGGMALVAERRLRASNHALERAVDVLEEQSAAKTQLLATVSHELRTPLNSIIGFSGILSMGLAGTLTPEQRTQVGIINSESKHLLALINDILDLSKFEAGRIVLVAEEFDANEVLDSVAGIVRPLAEERGLALRVAPAAGEAVLYSDRRRVEQVLINVAANAVKYTDSGFVALAVVTGEHGVDFVVEDTGAGITPGEADALFAHAHRLDGGLPRLKGQGLGLMISRTLAGLLGGEISVRSSPGCGSIVTFRVAHRLPHPPPDIAG